MDFKNLASKLGLDEDDFQELVELFITTSMADIDKIKKGVASNDPAGVSAAAHSIKGAAGNLGFEDIYSLTLDMEMQAKDGSLANFDDKLEHLENQINSLESQ
ncbi:MAG: Hpt domain-containing protein [Desulfobacteraceae bacterium]|nr:Hpt domain-containing protein [Desulfobacteraceae bacterium]